MSQRAAEAKAKRESSKSQLERDRLNLDERKFRDTVTSRSEEHSNAMELVNQRGKRDVATLQAEEQIRQDSMAQVQRLMGLRRGLATGLVSTR